MSNRIDKEDFTVIQGEIIQLTHDELARLRTHLSHMALSECGHAPPFTRVAHLSPFVSTRWTKTVGEVLGISEELHIFLRKTLRAHCDCCGIEMSSFEHLFDNILNNQTKGVLFKGYRSSQYQSSISSVALLECLHAQRVVLDGMVRRADDTDVCARADEWQGIVTDSYILPREYERAKVAVLSGQDDTQWDFWFCQQRSQKVSFVFDQKSYFFCPSCSSSVDELTLFADSRVTAMIRGVRSAPTEFYRLPLIELEEVISPLPGWSSSLSALQFKQLRRFIPSLSSPFQLLGTLSSFEALFLRVLTLTEFLRSGGTVVVEDILRLQERDLTRLLSALSEIAAGQGWLFCLVNISQQDRQDTRSLSDTRLSSITEAITLKKCQTVCVAGPVGSGKTQLLKKISEGQVPVQIGNRLIDNGLYIDLHSVPETTLFSVWGIGKLLAEVVSQTVHAKMDGVDSKRLYQLCMPAFNGVPSSGHLKETESQFLSFLSIPLDQLIVNAPLSKRLSQIILFLTDLGFEKCSLLEPSCDFDASQQVLLGLFQQASFSLLSTPSRFSTIMLDSFSSCFSENEIDSIFLNFQKLNGLNNTVFVESNDPRTLKLSDVVLTF